MHSSRAETEYSRDLPGKTPQNPETEKINEMMNHFAAKRRKQSKRRWLIIILLCVLILSVMVLIAALNHKKVAASKISNLYKDVTGAKVIDFANELSFQLEGNIGEIYELSDNTYYLVIYMDGNATGSIVCYDSSDDDEDPDLSIITKSDKVLDEDQIEALADDYYLNLNYSPPRTDKDALNLALEAAGTTEMDTEENYAYVNGKTLEDIAVRLEAERQALTQLFGGEEEPGDYSLMLTIKCRNVDLSKTVRLTLDSSVADMIGTAGELQIVLNDEQHCIRVSREQLTKLCNAYGQVTLHFFMQDAHNYTINFIDSGGNEIEELYGEMNFVLPADSELTYVYASYGGGKTYSAGAENRGGVYDPDFKTIEFPVYLSGNYELIGNEVNIADIDKLSSQAQEAVEFMASMGFMELDKYEKFYPNKSITRSELLKAIVQMFLAIDETQSTELTDVVPDSDDYTYVASGIENGVLMGYLGGTFGGENAATVQETLTICAKTLNQKYGYEYPSNADELIQFSDKSDIDAYAKDAIALMISEGFIQGTGSVRPNSNASRSYAAKILYKMYCELYDFEFQK